MQPLLRINQIRSNDENMLSYRITITQGADIITTEDDLIVELKDSILNNKETVHIVRVSYDVWEVKVNR